MIKIYKCYFCKLKGIDYVTTRSCLRKHLGEKHIKNKYLTNLEHSDNGNRNKYIKQDWWIAEEIN